MVKTLFNYIDFSRKTERIISHVVFWIAAYFFFVVFYGRTSRDYHTTIIFVSFLFPIAIASTYLLIYYLIPKFLLQDRKALFFLLLVYLIIITGWLSELVSLFIFTVIADYRVASTAPITFDSLSLIVGLYFVNLIAVVIKQVKRAFLMQQKNTDLEQKKLETELKLKEAELNLLKAQIHPHFLFNTLNNLYGLTLEKSELAPDLVLRISDMLDYMLYKCNQPKVDLQNELKHLQNYIEIEQLRYGERLKMDISYSGEAGNLQIAPMLLLPFVENAFKHGVSKQISQPYIRMNISIQDLQLQLFLENSFNGAVQKEEDYSKGIGLKNVKKRLEMLYPEKYSLSVSNEETIFRVDFSILLEPNTTIEQ
jgi:hypothetical protein